MRGSNAIAVRAFLLNLLFLSFFLEIGSVKSYCSIRDIVLSSVCRSVE